MDFAKILAQLREELKNVDAAIQTLERLQQSSLRRRGSGTGIGPSSQDALPSPTKNATSDRISPSRKARRGDPTPT